MDQIHSASSTAIQSFDAQRLDQKAQSPVFANPEIKNRPSDSVNLSKQAPNFTLNLRAQATYQRNQNLANNSINLDQANFDLNSSLGQEALSTNKAAPKTDFSEASEAFVAQFSFEPKSSESNLRPKNIRFANNTYHLGLSFSSPYGVINNLNSQEFRHYPSGSLPKASKIYGTGISLRVQ